MSLRARMGVAAGGAVAIAVLAVAISAYAGMRSELRGQVDQSLQALRKQVLGGPRPGGGPGGGGGPPGRTPLGSRQVSETRVWASTSGPVPRSVARAGSSR